MSDLKIGDYVIYFKEYRYDTQHTITKCFNKIGKIIQIDNNEPLWPISVKFSDSAIDSFNRASLKKINIDKVYIEEGLGKFIEENIDIIKFVKENEKIVRFVKDALIPSLCITN